MSNFIYSNARCVALENKILSRKKLLQMIESNNLQECLKTLTDNKIGMQIIENPYDYELLLCQEKEKLISLIKSFDLGEDIENYFLLPQDFLLAEIFVKSKFSKNIDLDTSLVESGLINKEELSSAIKNKNYELLPKSLKFALQSIDSIENISGKQISIILKKNLYENMNSNNKFLSEIIKTKIDLINIETAFRSSSKENFEDEKIKNGTIKDEIFDSILTKNKDNILKNCKNCYLFEDIAKIIENENNFNLFLLEKKIDDLPLLILKKVNYETSGIIPFLRYTFYVLSEIKNIRIVFVGLINNLSKEEIISRLRCNYEG